MNWDSQNCSLFWDLAAKVQQKLATKEELSRFYALRCEYFAYLMNRVVSGDFTNEESKDLGVLIFQLADKVAIAFGREGADIFGEVWLKITKTCQIIAGKENPWAFVYRIIYNMVYDLLRAEKRWSSRKQSPNSNDDDSDPLDGYAGGGIPPDEEVLLRDMERQLTMMLTPHFNEAHVAFFIAYFQGERIVDLALKHKVTENAVQLAIRRMQEFLRPRWKR